MNIKIIVATHKSAEMPKDSIYLPLHVGCAEKEKLGFIGDNTGDNISSRNSTFCELTGLYWAWKNLDYDYIGLVHYRRYFKGKKIKDPELGYILTRGEAEKYLKDYDIILPDKRNYYIETLYSHYAHTHNQEDMDKTREVLLEKYPDYVYFFDRVMGRTKGYMFNMFITDKEKCSAYCQWLFDILFELEKRIDLSNYSAFEARVFGRISELLLNVWVEKQGYRVKELPFIYIGKINWKRKITGFLNAKFLKKKYDKSF